MSYLKTLNDSSEAKNGSRLNSTRVIEQVARTATLLKKSNCKTVYIFYTTDLTNVSPFVSSIKTVRHIAPVLQFAVDSSNSLGEQFV